MKNYIFTWYDEDTSETAIMRLTEKQAELIKYLFEELAFGEILKMGNVTAELTDTEKIHIIDFT